MSSAGKSSVTKEFPSNFKKISMDDMYIKLYEKDDTYKNTINEFHKNAENEALCNNEYYKRFYDEIKSHKNYIIDVADPEDKFRKSTYFKDSENKKCAEN